MKREEFTAAISEKREPWDVVVIGGGATGVGCAVDAATRGFSVLLLEQHDFGKGTTPQHVLPRHIGHEERSAKLLPDPAKTSVVPTPAHLLAIGDVVAVGFHGMELMARAMSSSTDAAASGDESPAGVTYGLAFQGMAAETQGQLFRLIGELRVAGRLTTPAGD